MNKIRKKFEYPQIRISLFCRRVIQHFASMLCARSTAYSPIEDFIIPT